jgi:hypothetical protein
MVSLAASVSLSVPFCIFIFSGSVSEDNRKEWLSGTSLG